MKNIIAVFLLSAFSFSSLSLVSPAVGWAHEDHDHDGPSTVQAPKGGIIKSTEDMHIEVVAKGKEIKVYFYTMDLKPVDLSKQKITLKAELPRTKKSEVLVLKTSGNLIESTFDAKGAHRYILVVTLSESHHEGGKAHEDKLNFNIEPRK